MTVPGVMNMGTLESQPCFQRGRFVSALGRVAPERGGSLGHREFNVSGQVHADGHTIVEHHFDVGVLLEIAQGFAQDFCGQLVLIEALLVQEIVELAVGVQVLGPDGCRYRRQ